LRVGVVSKPHRTEFARNLEEILQWLRRRGCETLVEESVLENFGLSGYPGVTREQMPSQVDAIIVFGGDGTILSVARSIGDNNAPILAVNLGSLGFLTEVTLDELYEALDRLLKGEHRIDERRLLDATVKRSDGSSASFHALNDVVITKGALARIIQLDAYIDEDFMATFLADGLIIATPTGSTAYSLAAGGPIVLPSLACTVVTPICPHTLTNRPLVFPPESEIRITLTSGEDVMLTVDGQQGVELAEEDEIVCTSSRRRIELIKPHNKSFFDVLREKLKWAQR
jgi:NAD+ kinase